MNEAGIKEVKNKTQFLETKVANENRWNRIIRVYMDSS